MEVVVRQDELDALVSIAGRANKARTDFRDIALMRNVRTEMGQEFDHALTRLYHSARELSQAVEKFYGEMVTTAYPDEESTTVDRRVAR